MEERFKRMFDASMEYEVGGKINGYVNDESDNGGETVYGITRKNHPNLKVWASLDAQKGIVNKRAYRIPDDEMEEILNVYHKDYYSKLNVGYINDDSLGMQLFDFGINAGVSRSAKTLQKILRVTTDGIVGRQTVTTANLRKASDLREAFRKARIEYYAALARKGHNAKYYNGWVRRANECDKSFLQQVNN